MAVLLSLWGADRIADQLHGLGPALIEAVEQDQGDVEQLFSEIDSTVVPLLLTAATVVILHMDEALAGQPLAALIQGVTWVLLGVPLWTAIWYLTLQLGLNRLGRGRLTLQHYREIEVSDCGRWGDWRSQVSGCCSVASDRWCSPAFPTSPG